jgi:hypothetical protein
VLKVYKALSEKVYKALQVFKVYKAFKALLGKALKALQAFKGL